MAVVRATSWLAAFATRHAARLQAQREERERKAAILAAHRRELAEARARRLGLVVYTKENLTLEEQREGRNAWLRKYRELRKLEAGLPVSHRKHKPYDRKPGAAKGGQKPKYATEEERRAARKERMRKYHLLRKSGNWVRKNRIFSERIAKSAGIEINHSQTIDAIYKKGNA